MKRIIIILIIVFCILFFMEIPCLANESDDWNYMHYTDKVVCY